MTEESSVNDRDAPNIEPTEDPDQIVSIIQSEWTRFENPSMAVVYAVAAATNSDPLDISPLHDTLDTDAFNALMLPTKNSPRTDVHVSFQ